jgi:hypothetical protein
MPYNAAALDRAPGKFTTHLKEVGMRFTRIGNTVLFVVVVASLAPAQEKTPAKAASKGAELSNAQYTAKALAAAPSGIAKDAGVSRMDKDGKMQTLRESKNGFTCMFVLGNPMCADANSLAFFDAYSKHENPPDKLGVTYMLRGDKGASNTDPYATAKTADNHWVVTGPHIMLVGPGVKLLGLTESADADPTTPSLMWSGTPYEHAMIPVGGSAGAAKKAVTTPSESEKK